jgi:hypothetical protein
MSKVVPATAHAGKEFAGFLFSLAPLALRGRSGSAGGNDSADAADSGGAEELSAAGA